VDADQLLHGMVADQRAAVTCPETATVLHAGAGSGKTRVLTHRIAYRIAKGTADPQRVLAITFTREAASEMRRRLKTLVFRVTHNRLRSALFMRLHSHFCDSG